MFNQCKKITFFVCGFITMLISSSALSETVESAEVIMIEISDSGEVRLNLATYNQSHTCASQELTGRFGFNISNPATFSEKQMISILIAAHVKDQIANYSEALSDISITYNPISSCSGADDVAIISSVDRVDSDGDGLFDSWEKYYFGNLSRGPDDHDDNDVLTNIEEQTYLTDPTHSDTDRDYLDDGNEVVYANSDPRDKDTDDDGKTDWEEVAIHQTSPIIPD